MSELFASVAGHRVTALALYVPNVGPWFVELDVDDAVDLSGRVSVQLGALTLSGTVAPASSGKFLLASRVRVVAGGGGWGQAVKPQGYHNEAGVRAQTVAEDAARLVGETIGSYAPPAPTLGNDYARRAVPASRILEDTLGGTPWWVDYDGVTNAGPRPATTPAVGSYELLEYDPSSRVAVLAVDNPAAIGIGSTLTDRLAAPIVVRDLTIEMHEGKLRVKAWCPPEDATEGRLERLFIAIARRATDGKLFGKYRYRLVSMAPDGRCNLQAVSKAVGLPDLLPISQAPGVSGVHAELTPGVEVYVEFVAGDPADPLVTGYAGKGEPGFVPTKLILGAASAGSAPAAARQGDAVRVLMPPMVFTGTIGGSPASGVLTAPTGYTLGTIDTGSGKVGIGT